MNTLHVQNV